MSNNEPVLRIVVGEPKLESGDLSRTRLLRSAADTIENLGQVDVLTMVMHEELTDGKWVPEWVSSISVYYGRQQSPSVGGDRNELAVTDTGEITGIGRHRRASNHISSEMLQNDAPHGFCVTNARDEPDYCSAPKLLRRIADAVDSSKVEIDDLVLYTYMTVEGRVPVAAVYYSRPSRAIKKSRKEWERYEKGVTRDMKKQAKRERKIDRQKR